MSDDRARSPQPDEPPPILGRWRNVYVLVLAELALVVILLRLLARWAA